MYQPIEQIKNGMKLKKMLKAAGYSVKRYVKTYWCEQISFMYRQCNWRIKREKICKNLTYTDEEKVITYCKNIIKAVEKTRDIVT